MSELLTAPGQIVWEGILIDVAGVGADYWLTDASRRIGWSRTQTMRNPETTYGAAPGLPRPNPMYPIVTQVACATPELLVALEEAMVASYLPGELAWWDVERDIKYVAEALPQQGEPVTADEVQFLPYKLIDLQWFIGATSTIEVVGS